MIEFPPRAVTYRWGYFQGLRERRGVRLLVFLTGLVIGTVVGALISGG